MRKYLFIFFIFALSFLTLVKPTFATSGSFDVQHFYVNPDYIGGSGVDGCGGFGFCNVYFVANNFNPPFHGTCVYSAFINPNDNGPSQNPIKDDYPYCGILGLNNFGNLYGGSYGFDTTTYMIKNDNGDTWTASAYPLSPLIEYETSYPSPPNVGEINAPSSPVLIDTAINASATFTDPGVLDTHTASWNWGDGSTTTGTVTENNGSGTVSDIHTYTAAGIYPITLTVTDNDGLSNTATYQYISVYNPTSQGLFSAGHLFTSPAGAYQQDLSLTGKVTFGLVYKYHGTIPTSNKQFTLNFNAANLTFNATTISSLVIANNMATLTGSGTINGSGNYNFLVTGVNSGGIRIQITNATNNNLIYDTQPGAASTATPTTSVTGNVVVH